MDTVAVRLQDRYVLVMTKKRAVLILTAALLVLAVCSCSTPGAGTYTVSGVVSGTDWYFINPVVVTVSLGSLQYTAQVNLANPNVAGAQTVEYSIEGVPSGTYTVTLTTLDNAGGPIFASGYPAYSVNGGSAVPVPSGNVTASGSGPETRTITLNGMIVSGSETLDLDFGTAQYL
jgi:hypothetical protein